MNNKFDSLAKLALNEASLGDYMKAAARATVHGVAKTAQIAGKTIQGAGKVYSAIGGGEGGKILQAVGGSTAKLAGGVGKKMSEWGVKHKTEIEKRDLQSAPYKLLASQQEKGMLPVTGEVISTVMPDSKQIVRMQVVDVNTNATANKDKEGKKVISVTGPVTVISQPVEQNDQFDTAITKFNDINKPLQNITTTTFLKNNAATRLSQLNAIVTKKEHDPLFGNRASWQLRSPSLNPTVSAKNTIQPKDHESIFTDNESNRSYIFRGTEEGGWAPYNISSKAIGTSLQNTTMQKNITKAWQAQQTLKATK